MGDLPLRQLALNTPQTPEFKTQFQERAQDALDYCLDVFTRGDATEQQRKDAIASLRDVAGGLLTCVTATEQGRAANDKMTQQNLAAQLQPEKVETMQDAARFRSSQYEPTGFRVSDKIGHGRRTTSAETLKAVDSFDDYNDLETGQRVVWGANSTRQTNAVAGMKATAAALGDLVNLYQVISTLPPALAHTYGAATLPSIMDFKSQFDAMRVLAAPNRSYQATSTMREFKGEGDKAKQLQWKDNSNYYRVNRIGQTRTLESQPYDMQQFYLPDVSFTPPWNRPEFATLASRLADARS